MNDKKTPGHEKIGSNGWAGANEEVRKSYLDKNTN
jgi:hypothetical protein